MVNILIVDDCPIARYSLEKQLQLNFKDTFLIQICENVDNAINTLKKFKPQLVFLDIEMPNKNGFELLNEVEIIDFEIIFTTSYPAYAIKALQAEALDYLLKPILKDDLVKAIERFKIKLSKKEILNSNGSTLSDSNESKNDNGILKKIALPTESGYEFINVNAIIYCEANSNYCKIICNDGKEFLLAKTLKNIQELLPNDIFQRIHKSYLVNLNYIARFDRVNSLEIELYNGKKLPVSFRQKNNFLNIYRERA